MEYEAMFGYRLKMLVDDPEEIENLMTKVLHIYCVSFEQVLINFNIHRSINSQRTSSTLITMYSVRVTWRTGRQQ